MWIAMVEVDEQSKDKNDSELCDIALSEQAETMIVELNTMHGEAKDKVFDLIATLKRDGLKEHQIKQVIFSRVKFISKRRLYEIIPEEYKREYTKPLPKPINITTEHKVIEQPEQYIGSPEPEREHKGADAFNYKPEPEEDPKDTEIDFLKEKVTELEDALKQTEQFKPASKLTEEQARDMTMKAVQTGLAVPETNVESVTEWLKKQADGTHSFYYDAYGIDLFKNRELSQLKNSGVKVFKRLYFEV